jgi:cell division initiation protein
VVDYLRSVADEMEELIRERNNLREQVREKDLSIIEFRERDELLKNTITTATKMSDKIQADAEREARLIINDANQKAEMIVSDARDSLKRIYTEITDLKKLRMQFENNIRAIVQSHLTMLEQGHKVMPNPQIESQVVPASSLQSTEPRKAQESNNSEEQEIRSNVTDVVKRAAQLPNVDPL